MIVATDDQARRLRNVWLGGHGFEWPVAARYSAWGLFLTLSIVGAVLAFVLLPALWTFVAGLPAAVAMALLVTRKTMKHVTAERTLRSHVLTFQAEIRAPRPRDEHREFTVTLAPVLIQE